MMIGRSPLPYPNGCPPNLKLNCILENVVSSNNRGGVGVAITVVSPLRVAAVC